MVKAVSAGTLEIEFITNVMRMQGELNQIKDALGKTYKEAVREHNKAEAAAERYAAALEREQAAIGKTARQIKLMEINANALAAEQAGFTGLAQRIRTAGVAFEDMGQSARKGGTLARHDMLNMSAQIQDIVVGLQGGQKPMTVFLQQGSQLAGIAAASGVGFSGMAKSLLGLGKAALVAVLPFWPLIAAAGAVFTAFKLFQSSLSDDANLKGYANTLGLTKAEMKKLGETSITAGDMITGLWRTVMDGLNLAGPIAAVKGFFADLIDSIVRYGKMGIAGYYALWVGGYRAIMATWRQFPAAFADLFIQAVNIAIDKLNGLGAAANKFLGVNIFGSIAKLENTSAGAARAVGKTFSAELKGAYGEAMAGIDRGVGALRGNIIQAGKDRLKAEAEAMIADRTEKKAKVDKEAEKAARELAQTYDEIIGKLDPLQNATKEYEETIRKIGKLLAAGLLGDGELGKAYAEQLMAAADEAKKRAKGQWVELAIPDFKLDMTGIERLSFPLDDIIGKTRSLRDEFILLGDTAQHALSGIAESFGKGGQAISASIGALVNYSRIQAELDQTRAQKVREAGKNSSLAAKAEREYAEKSKIAQIGAMGDVASAAKGFFKERSGAYKALEKAEKAFRAIEFALSVKSMVQSAAESAAKIFASAKTTAVKAVEAVVSAISSLPFPLNLAAGAATIAALASIGVAIAGSFGGGGSRPTDNQGKGTVFGDSDAQSDSIKRSIDLLADLDTETLVFTRQMASSLKAIENNIGGLTNLIIRTGGTDGLNASSGVDTGFDKNLLGKSIESLFDPFGKLLGIKIPILSDILGGIGSLLGGLFGTKTKVIGAGVFGAPQSFADIDSMGFDGSTYSDIKRTKKFLGISTGSKYKTQFGELDGELEDQFGKLILSFGDAIKSAAGPLGLDLDAITAKLDSFVVDIGRVDLKDLTGEEIQEKLTAVFGALGDDMARVAVGGLDNFQAVGEGYLETLIRVASTVELVTNSLEQLGLSAQSLGIDASMAISDLFGGAQDYATAASSYFETYYSEAEQTAAKTAQLGKVFTSIGVGMPDSIVGFRALVEAQDLTTAAGQALYAQLLQIAPAFAEIVSAGQSASSAAAILRERQDLEKQLLEMQGDTAAIRAMELAQLDPSNRALQVRINALRDEATIANERSGLEREWLQMTGQTAALRAQELAALDPSNRALKAQIWLFQDQQKAAQDAAQKASQLADAWRGVGDSIMDEVKRIRALDGSNSAASVATLQAQFDAATVLARSNKPGSMDAAKSLPELSKALLEAAAENAGSSFEMQRLQGLTAASLEQTYRFTQQAAKAQESAARAAEQSTSVAIEQAGWWQSFSEQQAATASQQEAANDSLLTEVQGLREQIAGLVADQQNIGATVVANTGKIARFTETVTRGGDTIAVEVEGTVTTSEAA